MVDSELTTLVGLEVEQIWVWSQYVRLVFDIGAPGEWDVFVDVAEFRFTDAANRNWNVQIADPCTAAPVLALLHRRVSRARVRNWELTLDFDIGARIVCRPRRRFEAWAARPPGDDPWYCPPVNTAPDAVVAILRAAVAALAIDDTDQVTMLLDTLPPDADDPDAATDDTVLYVASFLLDQWLSGRHPDIPTGIAASIRPSTIDFGQPAADNLIALARKGRAFTARHAIAGHLGGRNVLDGVVAALAVAMKSWVQLTDTPISELADEYIV